MRMLIGIVFGCALVIGLSQAASSGSTGGGAPPPSGLSEDASEGVPQEGETGYECKYSPYCQRASQCEAYCGGGGAVCFQGCCSCAS